MPVDRRRRPPFLRILVFILTGLFGAVLLLILAMGITIKTKADRKNALATSFPATVGALADTLALQATGTSLAMQINMTDPFPATLTHVFGPVSGFLPHKPEDNEITASCTQNGWQNIVAEAVFHNPYDGVVNNWSYGILFRDTGENQQFRIVLDSDGGWLLTYGVSERTENVGGELPSLRTGAGEVTACVSSPTMTWGTCM